MLAKAKLDVAYFILYRPDLCGTSIWDDLHNLSESIFYTKCCIKWVVITRIHPCYAKSIDNSLSIDLAKASPDGLPNSMDTPSSGPVLQTSSSEQTQPILDPPGSPPELETPPPGQELLDLVSVYVRSFRIGSSLFGVQAWSTSTTSLYSCSGGFLKA